MDDRLSSATIDDLRQLFIELRAIADDGLFALTPNEGRAAAVDLVSLDQVNARLLKASRLILATQDRQAQ